MATLTNLVVKLTGDIGGFDSAMESAGGKLRNFGSQISNAGSGLTSGLTLPIVGTGTAALLMGNQFNEGMANVISLVPEAAAEIGGLSGDVQTLAADMGQSTGDMTGGLYQVVSAFGYSAESMDLLRIAATAGRAGLASTTDAINLVSAVTKGYGDTSAAAAQQTADMALKTVQLGQTTFPELAASIGRVTPLAANLGVSQQELFTTMAAATGVTGSAAEVSTQLRGVLQSLMAPTSTMTELISGMGYSNGEAMLAGLGLQGSIQAIVDAATASGTPLQSFMGSIEGQTLAMALAGPLSETYQQKLLAMGNAAGTTEAAFAAQTTGVNAAGFAMEQSGVRVQGLMQKLGNALGPTVLIVTGHVERFVGWLAGLVQRFTELDPKTQTIILGAIGLAAAIGPVLMVLGPLVSGLGVAVTVVGALASPIGLVVVAVGLLAAAFATDFMGIRTTVVGFWETHLQPIFNTLVTWLQTNIPVALAALAQFWETVLLPAIRTVWAWMEANLLPLLRSLANLYLAGVRLALAALALIWETMLKPALEALWKFIVEKVVPALQEFWELIDGPVKTALGIFEGGLAAVRGAIDGISGAIDGVIGWIDRMLAKLAGVKLPSWITSLPGGIADALGLGDAEKRLAEMRSGLQGPMGLALQPAPVGGVGGGRLDGRAAAGGTWHVTINVNGGATNAETGRAVEQGVLRAARSMGLR